MSTSVKNESEQGLSMMVASVRDFCKKEIVPHVRAWDEAQALPRSLFRALGELGLMGMLVPQAYGGTGLNYMAYTLAIAELAKVDPSVALSVAAHNSLCVGHILAFGTEAQKKKYLPALCNGKHLGAWALTEPGTGSDAGNMRTLAQLKDKTWHITGTKNFITNGHSADVLVIMARTGTLKNSHSMSAFIVERSSPGLQRGRKEDKLGMRASETAEVILEDCKVGNTQLLGQEGEGFIEALQVLDAGRISIAALGIGLSEGAYQAARQYAKERKQFGKTISEFQGISFKLVGMYVEIQASKALLESLVRDKDAGRSTTQLSAMTKYYSSEQAVRIAEDSVQILGGYGYIKDFPVEKFYRDAKLCTIGEGTSEIQKLIIARELLKK